MSILNQDRKINQGAFHALSRVQTEATQAPYEAKFKSAHNVRLGEVWGDPIPVALDFVAAQGVVGAVVNFVDFGSVNLVPIPGTNGQAWRLEDGDNVPVRPWVAPHDAPDPATNEPSLGYTVQLRTGGRLLGTTEGRWDVDYYAGVILFEQGYTPADLGWTNLQAAVFVYVGKLGAPVALDPAQVLVYQRREVTVTAAGAQSVTEAGAVRFLDVYVAEKDANGNFTGNVGDTLFPGHGYVDNAPVLVINPPYQPTPGLRVGDTFSYGWFGPAQAPGPALPAITGFDPTTGPAGTAVAISGANFGATAGSSGKVRFNGTLGTPTSWGMSSITVPVPAGATNGRITVTTAAGTATSSTDFMVASAGFNYPAPTITAEDDTNNTMSATMTPNSVPNNYRWELLTSNGSPTDGLIRTLLRVQWPNDTWTFYFGTVSGRVRVFRVKADGMTPDSPYATSTIAYTANIVPQANVVAIDSHSVRVGYRKLDLSNGTNQSTDLAIQVLTGFPNLYVRGGDGISISEANEQGNINSIRDYIQNSGCAQAVYIFDWTTNARRKFAMSSADVIAQAKLHIQKIRAVQQELGVNIRIIPVTGTSFRDILVGSESGTAPTESLDVYLAACKAWNINSAVADGADDIVVLPWYRTEPDTWHSGRYYGLIEDDLHTTPFGSLLEGAYWVAGIRTAQNTPLNDALTQVTLTKPKPDQVHVVTDAVSPVEISLDATAADPRWWPFDLYDVPDGTYPNARVRLPADPTQQLPLDLTISSGYEAETQAAARAARAKFAPAASIDSMVMDPLLKALKATGRLADVVAAHSRGSGVTPRQVLGDPEGVATWHALIGLDAVSDLEPNSGTRYRDARFDEASGLVNVAGGCYYNVILDSYEVLVKVQNGNAGFKSPLVVKGIGSSFVFAYEDNNGYHLYYRDTAGTVYFDNSAFIPASSLPQGLMTLNLSVQPSGMKLRVVGVADEVSVPQVVVARQIRLGGGVGADGNYNVTNELFSGALLLDASTPWTAAAINTLASPL